MHLPEEQIGQFNIAYSHQDFCKCTTGPTLRLPTVLQNTSRTIYSNSWADESGEGTHQCKKTTVRDATKGLIKVYA